MDTRIEALLEAMKKLEQELLQEFEKKEAEFYYRVVGRKVRFEAEIKKRHRALMQRLPPICPRPPCSTFSPRRSSGSS